MREGWHRHLIVLWAYGDTVYAIKELPQRYARVEFDVLLALEDHTHRSAQAAGLWIYFGIAIACGFGIGVAALGTGLGMGNAINGALQGTARNPEAGGKIMTTMIIGLALIESLRIYALLRCLLMVFKIPGFATFIEKVIN